MFYSLVFHTYSTNFPERKQMKRSPRVSDIWKIAKMAKLEVTHIRIAEGGIFQATLSPPQTQEMKEDGVRIAHIIMTEKMPSGEWQLHSTDELPNITTVRQLTYAKDEIPLFRYEIEVPE